MEIALKTVDRILIVSITGEIDHHTAEKIRLKIEKQLNRCIHIIIDFKNVSFMDSSGIGMIIGRYKEIEKIGGNLFVVSINPDLMRIFDISGLKKIISVYDSVEDAINALKD